ncbi:DNA polymerase III subunit epsilon [Candidatus Liberibacter africanus]|uniref:DNA polymerase III subunit epsilon n=1 Tax=Candidatus Liberibacter africanus PTSAPSY TaxID=1277257 RepID=A0A0G3I2P2_LIBAF|nr:DNA polymerase III subunit epsilon [Candidatus Liberibacter africanus]AKK20156.1 DNA polymerase III subunit epsilon [Candidatus Liberibacter africanus PTSAPSY]QTP63956.1 DNA polymerase III subunit epsilon [Candidatus Liberibacter africanus]
MRKIIFDIETTGLDPKNDRIIEIGAVELVDYSKTGRTFQIFISPGNRKNSPEAFRLHGIGDDFLKDKPSFASIFPDFWIFFNDQNAEWIAHNAKFDVGFINAELQRINKNPLDPSRITDTLSIARRKHPSSKNDLNSLCKRYGITISHRSKHGALLDSHLLADVYVQMMVGGSQIDFGFKTKNNLSSQEKKTTLQDISCLKRDHPLAVRITKEELQRHAKAIQSIGNNAIWDKYISSNQ